MTQIDHLGFLISDAVRLHPGRPALLQDNDVISYAELDDRANRVAGWLTERGSRPVTGSRCCGSTTSATSSSSSGSCAPGPSPFR